jgi:hypothetical protein
MRVSSTVCNTRVRHLIAPSAFFIFLLLLLFNCHGPAKLHLSAPVISRQIPKHNTSELNSTSPPRRKWNVVVRREKRRRDLVYIQSAFLQIETTRRRGLMRAAKPASPKNKHNPLCTDTCGRYRASGSSIHRDFPRGAEGRGRGARRGERKKGTGKKRSIAPQI